MNIKAVIATVVLGFSSVAIADPGITVSATARDSRGDLVVRDRRADSEPVAQHRHGGAFWRRSTSEPVTLATGVHFAGDGKTFINVPDHSRRFDSLELSAGGGRTFIQQISVEFDNGQQQIVRNVNATLIGDQHVTVNLTGTHRIIRRVVVYGKNAYGGWRRSAGGFTLTAV
jgi:hypothetical protein